MNIDTQQSEPMIRIRDLHYSRGPKMIFNGVDLDIPRGQITTVMGPSGTGKTTLLKLIGGQLKPARGSIQVDGLEVPKLRRRELYELRKRIGMLFQSGALLTDLSVFDNVAFPLREHTGLSEPLIHHLVLMRLQSVGLRGARDLYPSELSGGMARRVALARALILDPMMILYDEPFTGQDPISMGVLLKLVSTVNRSLGITSLLISHDISECLAISDYIVILSDGKVVASGSPDDMARSDSPWVRQFIDGRPDGPVPFQLPAPAWQDEWRSSVR